MNYKNIKMLCKNIIKIYSYFEYKPADNKLEKII